MSNLKKSLFCAAGVATWAAIVIYMAFYGVWMSAVVPRNDTAEFYRWAVNKVESENSGSSALLIIEDGKVANHYFGGVQERIDQHTLFPTASFSKWITALSVMTLVESNELDLDTPVSRYLTRWQLPASEFNNDEVTVRRLLSHTAGLTDELGFGEYGADEVIPSTEDELRSPRASSGADVEVSVGIAPGTKFQYSGGGYLVLQLVVEEVTGVTFVEYVRKAILEPLGMSRSTFSYIGNLENVTPSYDVDGSIAPTFQYASPAATGFASSASDLLKLVQAILGENSGLSLKSSTIEAMRKPHGFVLGSGIWGLGTILYAPTSNGDYVFGHDGANDPAINTTVRMNAESSDGIILLMSGHPTLASNIGSEWVLWQTGYPDFLQTDRVLRSAVVPIFIGSLLVMFAVLLCLRKRS